ncbi:MAG: rod shape-determining protein MreC [Gammaproteobacteria bacterium]|nr:rod shape-determining protein MreC [Gammaproteobacteria bacterium]
MALTTAEHDPGLFRGTSAGLRFVLIAILCITLMVLDHQNDHLVSIRKALAVVVAPVVYLVSSPSKIGHWIADAFASRDELQTENSKFKEQLIVSSAMLQNLAALKAENVRLRALLKSTEKISTRVIIAEIVTVDTSPYRQAILINKGSDDGVKVGEALIDADGVIGQIIRDRVFSSDALLITDADHAIPVELVRNRLRSIAVGTGEVDRLSMPFLPRNADIVKGDVLVTSGLGGTFPAGYPVGVITEVRSSPGQPFLEIDAAPLAMLNRIREVLVLQPEILPAKAQLDDGATE